MQPSFSFVAASTTNHDISKEQIEIHLSKTKICSETHAWGLHTLCNISISYAHDILRQHTIGNIIEGANLFKICNNLKG